MTTATERRRSITTGGLTLVTPPPTGGKPMSPRSGSAFKKYIEENDQLPPEALLGNIAIVSVEEAPFDAEKMRKEFERLNLHTGLLPRPLRADDAFEKATKKVEKHKYKVGHDSSLTAEILVRDAGREPGKSIHRKLVREIKDAQGHKLHLEEVVHLVFNTAQAHNGVIDQKSARWRAVIDAKVSASERPVLEELIRRIDVEFVRYRDFHDAQKVRTIVRAYMAHLDALMWKQSMYFVPGKHQDELQRFRVFLAGTGSAGMDLIPLPDMPSMRAKVTEVYNREAEVGLKDVAKQIATLIERGNVAPATFMKVKAEYDAWMAKSEMFKADLQMTKDRTAGSQNAVKMQLAALQMKIIGAPLNTGKVAS